MVAQLLESCCDDKGHFKGRVGRVSGKPPQYLSVCGRRRKGRRISRLAGGRRRHAIVRAGCASMGFLVVLALESAHAGRSKFGRRSNGAQCTLLQSLSRKFDKHRGLDKEVYERPSGR